jgi:hypothetical protein
MVDLLSAIYFIFLAHPFRRRQDRHLDRKEGLAKIEAAGSRRGT